MSTVYFTLVDSPLHKMPGHPESSKRFDAMRAWTTHPPYENVQFVEAEPATTEDVLLVHSPEMLLSLKIACSMGLKEIDPAPTYVNTGSYEAALLSAGGVLTLSRLIQEAKPGSRRGFAIVRPPGHHADRDHSMGFCLINNTAIAVADALERGMQKIAIIDIDAHHCNGTQEVFKDDQRVGIFSIHQEGIYPTSGGLDEMCMAESRILNLPLPAFTGDEVFNEVYECVLKPWLAMIQPEMIFVSAGFDGHFVDPLTALTYTTNGFYQFTRNLIEQADQYCEERLLFILEGGYDGVSLSEGIQAVMCAMADQEEFPNSLGDYPHNLVDIKNRIKILCNLHNLHKNQEIS